MKKFSIGDIVEGIVVDYGSSGEGILKIDDFAVFVPFVIVGEKIKAKLNHVKKNYAFAEVIEVLEFSKDRRKPLCPYFMRCGGCDIQHIEYDAQLKLKHAKLVNTLSRIGGISHLVEDIIYCNEWGYRNKLSLPFGTTQQGKRVVLGFYEKKSHNVVPMKFCPLHNDWASKIISVVTNWATEYEISVYDEKTHKGVLRHLVCRHLDGLCCTIVSNASSVPHIDKLIDELKKEFVGCSVYVNVNKKNSNVILGDRVKNLYGKPTSVVFKKFTTQISPLSFLQVNDDIRDLIYDKAFSYISDFSGDIVELYSGVGILTANIALSLKNANIVAVEIIKDATKNADALMKNLKIDDRVTNVTADVKEFMASITEVQVPRAIILDPPRRGCDESVLDCIKKAKFERIVYISCNAATLSRDLKILADTYEIKEITPFDMFPQTQHIETLVCLVRK